MKPIPEDEQEIELSLSEYFEVISRRRWIVLLIASLSFGASAYYAFYSAPVFRATTTLSIEKESGNAVQGQYVGEGQDDEYFETQFKLIASETQLRRVYADLQLADTKEFFSGLKSLKDSVSVLPVPHTRLANVNADSTSPQLAMRISSTLAQYFVEQNLANKTFMSKDVLDALQSRTKGADAEKMNESLPAVVNNRLIQDIKAQIFAAEAQLADLRMKYTDSHPAIISLKSRLESMKKVLNNEVGNIVQSLKTELSGQLRANNVRIIDMPALPDRPIRPRKGVALTFGLLGGLALGVFVALLIEMLDQTVRTQDDVERRLGVPFLGLIPYNRHKKGAPIYGPLLSSDPSLTSEAFRNLRTMVGFTSSGKGEASLLVTSSVQEEGKSFVATNMAVVLAQLGQRVLIVDGDLRRPRLHRTLQASNEKGLSDFLSGAVPDPAVVVQRTAIPHLDVVTCGPRPPNPAELLNTERLAEFLVWARGRYARVIVDCPPVFPISDILIWSHHVKPVIFVSRFGRTRVPLIRTALARLRHKDSKILGGVINGARRGTMTYADGRYYEQYYRDYVDAEKSK
ncbi:MAG TPA: polysaccharide biosynthesis tyrosine autokinase [Elusimicrobiota bacterium]|nr:polysaccharide biosynthesis tyrosine autokinase [Elusimicrobiota bacterium]